MNYHEKVARRMLTTLATADLPYRDLLIALHTRFPTEQELRAFVAESELLATVKFGQGEGRFIQDKEEEDSEVDADSIGRRTH